MTLTRKDIRDYIFGLNIRNYMKEDIYGLMLENYVLEILNYKCNKPLRYSMAV